MAKQQEKSNPTSNRSDENEQDRSKNPNQSYDGSSGSMFGNRESSRGERDRDIETDRESTKDVGRTTGSRTEREH